jgi:hypothetical protein
MPDKKSYAVDALPPSPGGRPQARLRVAARDEGARPAHRVVWDASDEYGGEGHAEDRDEEADLAADAVADVACGE